MENEIKEKMDSLVVQDDLSSLNLFGRRMIRDFKYEGFEDGDIYEYLCNKIKEMGY